MNSKFNIEQPVRLATHQHSLSGSEPKEILCNKPNDQEEFAVARRTTYKLETYEPDVYKNEAYKAKAYKERAAVFIS